MAAFRHRQPEEHHEVDNRDAQPGADLNASRPRLQPRVHAEWNRELFELIRTSRES